MPISARGTTVAQANSECTLLREGRTIQSQFKITSPLIGMHDQQQDQTTRRTKYMKHGNVKVAIRLLGNQNNGKLFSLNTPIQQNGSPSTVRDALIDKHPTSQPAHPETLLDPIGHPPILFEKLDGEMIALRIEGSAGPSGVDSYEWRRFCTSFKRASSELCNSVAMVARRISTTIVDPQGLAPLLACRLIALDKNPGIRPIGIGETIRRIMNKAILRITGPWIREAAGTAQLCAGQESGCEAAVHAMKKIFDDDKTEAIMLVDATNAFNSLNRKSAL